MANERPDCADHIRNIKYLASLCSCREGPWELILPGNKSSFVFVEFTLPSFHTELTLHNKESVGARGDPWACGDHSEGGPPPLHLASSLPPSITSGCSHLSAMIKMHLEVAFTLRVAVCCGDAMAGRLE